MRPSVAKRAGVSCGRVGGGNCTGKVTVGRLGKSRQGCGAKQIGRGFTYASAASTALKAKRGHAVADVVVEGECAWQRGMHFLFSFFFSFF